MAIDDELRRSWQGPKTLDLPDRCVLLAPRVGSAILRSELELRATRVLWDDLASALEQVLAERVLRSGCTPTAARFTAEERWYAHEIARKGSAGVPFGEVDAQGARMANLRRTAAAHFPPSSALPQQDLCPQGRQSEELVTPPDRRALSAGGKKASVGPKSQRKRGKPAFIVADNGPELRPTTLDLHDIANQVARATGAARVVRVADNPHLMEQIERSLNDHPPIVRARAGARIEQMFASTEPKRAKYKQRRRTDK
ncbi:hypothetical protein [Paraburkholderia caribensis]|uniref:hypothetical protein n=1 Tax=Paraburkholderia caribensis TaxID=75105 RepID=UPI0015901B4A|nr:hypothetical protein [Paraburkholderia caribensis]